MHVCLHDNAADIFLNVKKKYQVVSFQRVIVPYVPCKLCSTRFKIFLHAK
jgi:hypothetical protein